jgi:hypothetical protein
MSFVEELDEFKTVEEVLGYVKENIPGAKRLSVEQSYAFICGEEVTKRINGNDVVVDVPLQLAICLVYLAMVVAVLSNDKNVDWERAMENVKTRGDAPYSAKKRQQGLRELTHYKNFDKNGQLKMWMELNINTDANQTKLLCDLHRLPPSFVRSLQGHEMLNVNRMNSFA